MATTMHTRRPIPLLLCAAVLAGCVEDLGPASPELESAAHTLLGGLAPGEALTLSGAAADTVFLNGGPEGAEYLYIPFFASEAGTTRLGVELRGTHLQPPAQPAASASLLDEGPRPDWEFHERLQARTARELEPQLAALARHPLARRPLGSLSPAAQAVPAVGSLLPLGTATSCSDEAPRRHGRVQAVSRTAILVADTLNPVGGLTREDYEAYGRVFDELIQPTLSRVFGETTDLDDNGRVIVFFTRAVNELTPRGSGSYVAGYFWSGDLYPRSLCPAGNQAEIFYQLAPDPSGVVNGNTFPTDFVRARSLGVLGHEFQHLINAGRRMYVNSAEAFEATWLNEGLSHAAEEILFYAASGLQPARNITLEQLNSSPQVRAAVSSYLRANLERYALYLQQPEAESLLGTDNLQTRGAAWSFLRYLADRDPRSDEELFRALVNSRTTGVENLARVLGSDPVELMQDWSVSVYADDLMPEAADRFTQPSWNFRTIIPSFYQNGRFPLRIRTLEPERDLQLRLRGGGAGYVRVRGAAARQASVAATSSGGPVPDRLRVSVIRVR